MVAFLLGAVWFMAIVAQGVRYDSDLPTERSFAAVGLAMVIWVVVASIFSRSLI